MSVETGVELGDSVVESSGDAALIKRVKLFSENTVNRASQIATDLIRCGKPVAAANILQSAAVVAKQCKIVAECEWDGLQ